MAEQPHQNCGFNLETEGSETLDINHLQAQLEKFNLDEVIGDSSGAALANSDIIPEGRFGFQPNVPNQETPTIPSLHVLVQPQAEQMLLKRKLIQQQLVLLLHAHKCQKLESQANREKCSLLHCRTIKNVLNHMTTCQLGKSCTFPHCSSSRQIIYHWKHCIRSECPVCLPSRSTNIPIDQAAGNELNFSEAGIGGPSSMGNSLPIQNNQTTQPGTSVPLGSYSQSMVEFKMRTERNLANRFGSNGPYIRDSGIPPCMNSIKATFVAKTKEWHQSITPELRNHLVCKLIQVIFPVGPEQVFDKRMGNLVSYAQKVELDTYEMADSKSEYYHLLSEKIHKIQKGLEDRRQRRRDREEQRALV